jgi:hypothetical protein
MLVSAAPMYARLRQQKISSVSDGLSPRNAFASYIDSYVSPAHRDKLSGGPIVALKDEDLGQLGSRDR